MDGVIGPLEQAVFAVVNELHGEIAIPGIQARERRGRDDDRGGDVVLEGDFRGGLKIFAQTKRPPRAIGIEAHAQVAGDELAVVAFEFIARRAVDEIHAERLAPVGAPFRFVEALHGEEQLLDVLRDRAQPRVVFGGVLLGAGREQLDHRAERALGTEDAAAVALELPAREKTVAVIALNQFADPVEILREIADEHRPLQNRVADGFRDFRFAAARDGAGFVAGGALTGGADQPPRAAAGGLEHAHLVAGRAHIGLVGQQLDLRLATVGRAPGDGLLLEIEARVLGHVENVRINAINGIARRLHVHHRAVQFHDLLEAVIERADVDVAEEFLAEIVGRKRQRAAGVLFLAQAEEVRGKAELRFHLFLAVAEIVVGDDRDDGARFIARGDLEGLAEVVAFVLGLPAHAVAALALGGVLPARQAEAELGQLRQVRRQNHAARVAAPMLGVQAGVVLREKGIARIAENAFHKIEVAHQRAGREEANLHGLFTDESRHARAHHGPQQQRHETLGRRRLSRGERQPQQLARRMQRQPQQRGEHGLRHRRLVGGNR